MLRTACPTRRGALRRAPHRAGGRCLWLRHLARRPDRRGRDGRRRGRRRHARRPGRGASSAPRWARASSGRCAVAVAGRRLQLTAERAHLVADVDGMVDEALEASRDGGLPGARVARSHGRRRRQASSRPRVTYSRVAVQRFVRRVRAPGQPRAARRGRQLPDREPAGDPLADRAEARRHSGCAATVEAALVATGTDRTVRGKVRVVQPKSRPPSSARSTRTSSPSTAAASGCATSSDLKLAKTYKIAVGQVGLETPGGPLPRAEQGREPCLARAGQRLGRRPGRQGDPRRPRRQPAQVTLARDLRRRRHPRHRRDRLARDRRLARLHPHGDSRTSRSCTTRCRCRRLSTSSSAARLATRSSATRAARISSTVTSSQPSCSKEAWRSP